MCVVCMFRCDVCVCVGSDVMWCGVVFSVMFVWCRFSVECDV